ncbi:hypothetical protein BCR44DRAFT_1424793 [Catenaria anguillulae PL171]|uniref:Uncharacterized protein n=1 Tax=Catenaria anguillulae PL171 TaxID=765915 RepID=A0A1Y2I2X8_9FUNG|nr:hypothetical protein BCR44DRAFT_1424793 [Catenaria anguillulae PL171]
MSTQSFQSAGSARGAPATIAEGLVQCVVSGGIDVDVTSAMAAPVDALKAVVARFAGLVEENAALSMAGDGAPPVGFVADRDVQAGDLPEVAVLAVREVYHALRALRSPPPMYSEMAAGEAFL